MQTDARAHTLHWSTPSSCTHIHRCSMHLYSNTHIRISFVRRKGQHPNAIHWRVHASSNRLINIFQLHRPVFYGAPVSFGQFCTIQQNTSPWVSMSNHHLSRCPKAKLMTAISIIRSQSEASAGVKLKKTKERQHLMPFCQIAHCMKIGDKSFCWLLKQQHKTRH